MRQHEAIRSAGGGEQHHYIRLAVLVYGHVWEEVVRPVQDQLQGIVGQRDVQRELQQFQATFRVVPENIKSKNTSAFHQHGRYFLYPEEVRYAS